MTLIRRESGYTLIEMLIVMSIMGLVMTAVTTLFVQASNAEVDMNGRFQAQQSARLALDKIRREAHCAQSVTLTGNTKATINFPASSPCGTSVSWCTAQIGSGSRYGLYRQTGASCSSAGTLYVDYLTSGSVFTYAAQSSLGLAKLSIDFPVNVKPSRSFETYELKGDVALRNSTRT